MSQERQKTRRTPFELAALATAAIPELSTVSAGSSPDEAADFASAIVKDTQGRLWRVRSPNHPAASARLENEFQVLSALSAHTRADLPFSVPTVGGTYREFGLTTFVYSHLPGQVLSIEDLVAHPGEYGKSIGKAIAAVHNIAVEIPLQHGLPEYSANDYRLRQLTELDQLATSGKIPARLLKRWEHALEDVALWRFTPTVTHGELHEENIYFDGDQVRAITGWSELKVADPADDFAWLVAASDPALRDEVLKTYREERQGAIDPRLMERAAFSAEFALAHWLGKGLETKNAAMIGEAEEMLETLNADLVAQEERETAEREAQKREQERVRAEREERLRQSAAGQGPDGQGPAGQGSEAQYTASQKAVSQQPSAAEPAPLSETDGGAHSPQSESSRNSSPKVEELPPADSALDNGSQAKP